MTALDTRLAAGRRAGSSVGAGRLLAAPVPDLATHLRVHGPLPDRTAADLLEQVRRAGLTGRGGAGFPTAVKLAAVAQAGSSRSRPVIVGNGAEGEPASVKDRQLLTGAPHLVLDGLQLAGAAAGATDLYLYVLSDAAAAVRVALRERPGGDRITVTEAPDTFVSGQETAVVSRLNGGPALPADQRVRVTERGVRGRPTLVQNVETLAHLALIARHGGDWFAGVGTPEATGTFLATVHGPQGPRVWEVPHGLPLGRLLAGTSEQTDPNEPNETEHSESGQFQAVLVGGYHGTWLPVPGALDAPLSRSGLAPFNASIGAGVIIPLAGTECGLEATARIVRYLAAESARQCGPCLFGLPHLANLITELAAGRAGTGAVTAIERAAGLVEGRGACHHPDGTARLVRSALTTFERDVVLHGHGRCLARIAEPYGGML